MNEGRAPCHRRRRLDEVIKPFAAHAEVLEEGELVTVKKIRCHGRAAPATLGTEHLTALHCTRHRARTRIEKASSAEASRSSASLLDAAPEDAARGKPPPRPREQHGRSERDGTGAVVRRGAHGHGVANGHRQTACRPAGASGQASWTRKIFFLDARIFRRVSSKKSFSLPMTRKKFFQRPPAAFQRRANVQTA